jgi:hypothetical protein
MVNNVTSNYATMQNQMPEPKLPIDTGLKILGGLGLLAAGGYGLHKLFGEKETTPVKSTSIDSRKIGAGPQMNVNTGEPRMVGDLFPADVSTKPAGPTPETPTVPLNTEVGKAPKEMSMIEQGLANKEINAVAEGRKQEAVKPPKKSSGPIVYKSPVDIPEGMVFRPDVGNLDRSLVNTLGTEGRLHAKELINKGMMFGHYQGDPKLYNQAVSNLINQYSTKLKETLPSVELTTRQSRIAQGLEHEKNHGAALGKAAKVAGVLGTLMTVAQSANAREAAANVAEGLLPIGLTPSELASGKLTEKQLNAYKEAQKLGSPYRSVPPPR